jgi:ferritin-like metal-binding protein YciE
MTGAASDTAREIFVVGLRNTHGLETQALQIMNRQVERLENYPEVEQSLRRHIQETEGQRQRLEEVMNQLGETPSAIKEAAMGFMGNVAAAVHAPADDEIIKNMLANHGFENYEIAAYKSLLIMAEAANFTNVSGFQQSLREEQAMAQAVADMIEPVTRKYIQLSAQNVKAKI